MKISRAKIFIILFSILYVCVGFVSTYHAIAFFSLANAMFLGIVLACTFEVGQATVLFSILSSKKDRSKVMPWILMTILTFVQVLGNVFSTYKYLMVNSINELKYFKEPVLWWTELPDQTCNVILTYIIGAILPIVALCMTGMVETFLEDSDEEESKSKNNSVEQENQKKTETTDETPKFTPTHSTTMKEIVENIPEDVKKEFDEELKEEQNNDPIGEPINDPIDEPIDKNEQEPIAEVKEEPKESHFINLKQ